jgi:hypothetical protein
MRSVEKKLIKKPKKTTKIMRIKFDKKTQWGCNFMKKKK